MRCSKCNTENTENSKFCIICGEMLENKKDVNPDFDDKCKICKENIKDTKHQEYLLGVIGEVLCARCAETIYRINNTKDYDEYADKTDQVMTLLNSGAVDRDGEAILLGEINWDRFADEETSNKEQGFMDKNPVEILGETIRNEVEYGKINDINQAAKQAVSNLKSVKDQIKGSLPDGFADSAKQTMYNFKGEVSGAINNVSGKSGWYRIVKVIGYLLLLVSTVAGGALGYASQRATSYFDVGGDEVAGMLVGALIGFVLGGILLCITMMFAEMASNISTTVDLLSSINEKLDKGGK